MNAGKAEQWLISFTKQLRSKLPAGKYIITHARTCLTSTIAPASLSDPLLPGSCRPLVLSWQQVDWRRLPPGQQGSRQHDRLVQPAVLQP